jgi:hypothetical protein
LILWLLLLIQFATAQWFEQDLNAEVAFGVTNQELENPNSTKAIYKGYGGHAKAYYPLSQNESFSFGIQAKYFYSELTNEANTAQLSEDLRTYGVAPGLELKVSWFFAGYNYKFQRLSLTMSGTIQNKISSRFEASEYYAGVEIPLENWALRLYYLHSQGDLPSADSGLNSDSPWQEDSVFLAIRYRFSSSRRSSYDRNDMESSPIVGPRLHRRSFRQNYSDKSYLND